MELIEDIPDFPKEGILFKDITPILKNSAAFKSLVDHLCQLVPKDIKKLVAIESRGFILGAAMAQKMGIGLVLARKPGKLPRPTLRFEYSLEYGTDALEVHKADITKGDKIAVIDDVLATGGTAHAVERICLELGADLVSHIFLLEIKVLKGRNRLSIPAQSLFSV